MWTLARLVDLARVAGAAVALGACFGPPVLLALGIVIAAGRRRANRPSRSTQ